jgi:hypothetical protein
MLMPDIRSEFIAAVVTPLVIPSPTSADRLTYDQYLQLDPSIRTRDESAIVDARFTPGLLHWLGYVDADWVYNLEANVERRRRRPDFVIRPLQATAFVVEDKNTTHQFCAEDVEQLRRYTAGTQGYALWTNAHEILALRFLPAGTYEILAHVPVHTEQLDVEDLEHGIQLLKFLFEKRRFVEMPGILERICVDEDTWLRSARPVASDEAQHEFIRETSSLLDSLTLAARAAIDLAESETARAALDHAATLRELDRAIEALAGSLAGLAEAERRAILQPVRALCQNPLNVDEDSIQSLRPTRELGAIAARDWATGVTRLLTAVGDFRERELSRRPARQVHGAFQVWKERYRIIEGERTNEAHRRTAYAEQVAYAFFVRLLLARILEDKGIIHRIISDGGLTAWRNVVQPDPAARHGEVTLHSRALLEILFRTVSTFYQHFFHQPVFDWFEPDDYLLAIVLERLSTFSFAAIDRDILGYAYEAYVERSFRGAKGHFLTRGQIVEYVLDEAGYMGRATIGRRIIDPAVGSGSFLVHAARRLREALAEAVRELPGTEAERRELLARQFIEHLQRDFVGHEINPFSCYLAELNLFLQALDDVLFIWRERGQPCPVEQFQIFNTNSLLLPRSVLHQQDDLGDADDLGQDQAADTKRNGAAGFDFVVMNPPYINRAIEQEAMDLSQYPFYDVVFGGGDINHYLGFIRLANYYVREGGIVSIIVPLNLYGDISAGAIRRWLAAPTAGQPPDALAPAWSLVSLTRFFSRTVLFPDVTQGVCVTAWRRAIAPPDHRIRVAGGVSVEDARGNRVELEQARVIATDPRTSGLPVNDLWSDAWAVVPDLARLGAWERLRAACVTDMLQWSAGRVVFQQGDVNITRTKPLRPLTDGGQVAAPVSAIPVVGGRGVTDFGPYSAESVLDAKADVQRMNLPEKVRREADRERQDRLERILNLEAPEAVCVLKDIVGIEPARPMKGALYHRGSGSPLVCFGHTLEIIYPKHPRHNALVEAIFALLMSSASNFVMGLFSTNVHVTRTELQRMPIPDLSNAAVGALAELGRALQTAGNALAELRSRFGCRDDLMDVTPSPAKVLAAGTHERDTLQTAVLRRDLVLPIDSPMKLSTLVDRGNLSTRGVGEFDPRPESAAYLEAATLLLHDVDVPYSRAKDSSFVPTPAAAADFLRSLASSRAELEAAHASLATALARTDRYVLGLYGINDLDTCALVGKGMPWASTALEWANAIVARLGAVDDASQRRRSARRR